jgi:serine-type D-ala-D-ala carboxypeptidase
MMYPSSNVATVMLSHAISKTNEEYIKMMNDKAKELGMTNSKFYNPSGAVVSAFRGLYVVEGVPDEYNQTTARDLATLAYYFLKNYPEFLEITREPAVTTMEGTPVEETFYTLNQLASGMPQGYFDVDGFKTGSSPNAALNHVITAKGKGRRLIEVLMGVGSWSDYNTSVFYRAQFGNALLEKGFTEYHEETVLKAGVHEIDGQKIKVEKDIKVLTRGDEKPTYKLVGDEIIVEHTFPTLTKEIKSNVFKVTKVVEETTTEEVSSTEGSTNGGILSFDEDSDLGTFANWLRSLSKNPLLLAGIILTLSVFISGIVLATVQVFKKKD